MYKSTGVISKSENMETTAHEFDTLMTSVHVNCKSKSNRAHFYNPFSVPIKTGYPNSTPCPECPGPAYTAQNTECKSVQKSTKTDFILIERYSIP